MAHPILKATGLQNLSRLQQGVLTAAIVTMIAGMQLVLTSFTLGYPYQLFFVGVLLCSVLFRQEWAIAAIFLSALYTTIFFVPPIGVLWIEKASDLVAFISFFIVSFVIHSVTAALRDRIIQLERARQSPGP